MTVPDGYSPLGPMGFDERALFGLTSAGGAIYTIADITQEKTAELSQRQIAEEVQQRKTQQERFIDMISHEVRNPLSAILHCTEDILNAVHRIRDGAEHAGGDACDDCQSAAVSSARGRDRDEFQGRRGQHVWVRLCRPEKRRRGEASYQPDG
ncbi:hypothetical protein V6Z96_000495 [Aspergillus fumigatus]